MQNLYDQLLYNWERGFYSVVKDGDRYGIFSTKDKEGKLRYCYANSIDVAKTLIGEYQSTQFGYPDEEDISMMRFRGTIHPSELMGKGFQVGDKVLYEDEVCTVKRSGGSSRVCIENDYTEYMVNTDELKPVLPVEEKKEEWNYFHCSICDSHFAKYKGNHDCEAMKALNLLILKGIIKDGKVVNL